MELGEIARPKPSSTRFLDPAEKSGNVQTTLVHGHDRRSVCDELCEKHFELGFVHSHNFIDEKNLVKSPFVPVSFSYNTHSL